MRTFLVGVLASLVAAGIWFGATQLLGNGGRDGGNSGPTGVEPSRRRSEQDSTKARRYTTEIEGTLQIAHASGRGHEYSDDVSAEIGDELFLYAWYYNREDVASGLYASNLTVQFIPSQTRSEDQWLGVRIYGDNTNVVEDWVRAQVPPGAIVVPVPDTATWRHNKGRVDDKPNWITERITGDLFGRGVILEDAGPCLSCEATVRVLVRVTSA